MENACYYTFSTISQSLAGAFGFLVAVVLYQIQVMLGRLERGRSMLGDMSYHPGYIRFVQAEREERWSEMADVLEKNPPLPAPPNIPPDYKDMYERHWLYQTSRGHYADYIRNARQLASIKNGLERSLKGTGTTIGLSLALLMFTPLIAGHGWLAWLCLGLDVFFAGLCLASYFPLVNSVTK